MQTLETREGIMHEVGSPGLRAGVYPKAPRTICGLLGEGLGFGGLRFRIPLWGSKSLRVVTPTPEVRTESFRV